MKITTVLFDLDGTLLPMDQEAFIKAYLGLLAKKLAPLGYDPKKLVDAIWAGTGAMVKNNADHSNECAFWSVFTRYFGKESLSDMPVFDDFYRNEFSGAKAVCGFAPQAAATIAAVREKGLRVALATNPIFPAVATLSRCHWAGLNPEDFEFITTYENSSRCKPNPDYYLELMARLEVCPEECLMVGNDADEDLVAETLGARVFLLTDCLINHSGRDISPYPQGSFQDLLNYIDAL